MSPEGKDKTDQGKKGPETDAIRDDLLFFEYHFRFDDGSTHDFIVRLDPKTLEYLPGKHMTGSEWTRLEHHQCENCPLYKEYNPYCPVALSVEEIVNAFCDKFSYEAAEVTVRTNERTYLKKTTMQKGLSSIMGILMVSSGCPILDKLRPMVRFHLPFATILDTTFRTTGTYLLGQFFLSNSGRTPDFTFQGLVEAYRNIKTVNSAMAKRINSVATKDASVNALIILDMFAVGIFLSIEDDIKELESIFTPYFE